MNMENIVLVIIVLGFISCVHSKVYLDLLKQLDKNKCTEYQYSVLVVGDSLNAECRNDRTSRMFYAKNIFEVNGHLPVPKGIAKATENCLVSCVDKERRGFHAEQTIIANSGLILGNGVFRHASILTYFPPCSGGPSHGRPDCATRIVGLCTKYANRISVFSSSSSYGGGGGRIFSNTDDESTNGSVIYQGEMSGF